ncbi:type II toxin-antitoxin system RelE/ParE family toxin [Crocinitomix algicola]|uniref:type II toxin-antitoxin system RelE/ParE family toxin n=1 Tax=Crocinitomix algicola TaxID=1740263 RepID=UPI0008730555|nr:type II toxin-antitoxin system RelE/ParE family toxin [Crocinitomix algicola]
MAYKLITSPIADKDVEKAIKYYIETKTELAKAFLKEVRAVKKYLIKNPKKIQVRYSNVRIAFLKKFPYGIHFVFENDTIVIVGIFHTSKNPKNWKDRS